MFNNHLSITYFFIVTTIIITILAWYNPDWQASLIGYPYRSYHHGQWYRCFTQGLIHANIPHLVLNMYTFYSFGNFVEGIYRYKFGTKGLILFTLLYIGGVLSAALADVWFHADNRYYQSLGASAGVAAVMMSGILFKPFGIILFHGFIPILACLYGIAYLALSYYMIGGVSQTNHLSHLAGSLYGVAFTLVTNPDLLITYFELFKKYLNLKL